MTLESLDFNIQTLESWKKNKQPAAIATVIKTWQSSPRLVSSQCLVNDNLDVVGSVSGGCVESDVITLAQSCIQNQQCTIQTYGVSNDEAWSVGLTCGGEITVFIEPVTAQTLTLMRHCRELSRQGESCFILRSLDQGSQLISKNEAKSLSSEALLATQPTVVSIDADTTLSIIPAKPRLWLFGAVHTAVHLADFTHQLGFEVSVIDPRSVFATPQRFPKVHCALMWPQDFLDQNPINDHTGIVALNHDPKFDDVALASAMRANPFYIGALGSQKTHIKRKQRLAEEGFSASELDRIHSPIGLPFGNNTAAHIALSIAAEILACRYPKSKPIQQGTS